MSISILQGDIVVETTDAVVNAANAMLAPGGGVSGAIHSAGGASIADECRRILVDRGPIPTGEAVPTGAGDLPSRFVIHAVGPVWQGGRDGEAEALASAYRRSIEIADGLGLCSIAFPSISTGIYGYPVERAAPLALATAAAAMEAARNVSEIRFVLYDTRTFRAFEKALAAARV